MVDLELYNAAVITKPRAFGHSLVDNVYVHCPPIKMADFDHVLVNDMHDHSCPLRFRIIKTNNYIFWESDFFMDLKKHFPSIHVNHWFLPDGIGTDDGYATRDVLEILDEAECLQFLLTYGTNRNYRST